MSRRAEWWRVGLDPWYVRAWDDIRDWWACHIRRRHQTEMDSRGRCIHCGKPQPVTWVRRPFPGGGTYTDLTRLTDGRIMCQLCFGYFPREELHEVEPGVVEDACKRCFAQDAQQLHEKRMRDDPTHDRSSCWCCCIHCDDERGANR